MNTIKDLAVQWWESLPIKRNKELLFKYHPDESLDYKKIENIFYNEVILKWWEKFGSLALREKYPNHLIKEIYLKEHFKEEPYINKGLDYMIDLEQPLSVNKHIEVDEEKVDKKLIDIALSKFKNFGEHSKIDEPKKPYFKGKGEHSVNELEKICQQYKDYVSYINSQPKAIKDNVWDEFAKEYSQLHSLDLEQVRYWFIPLLEFGKQHYSLIKK